MVEPETENDMPRAWRIDCPLNDGSDKYEGLSRPGSAAQHDVARRTSQKAVSLSLFLRKLN